MIPSTLRFTLCIAVVCYFIIILYYLKKRMLDLKYTLLWLVAGMVMGVMVFFPELLVRFVRILGIESNMNGLYVLLLSFIIAILMALTSIASRQTLKIKILVQEISMMEKRIRDLENEQKDFRKIPEILPKVQEASSHNHERETDSGQSWEAVAAGKKKDKKKKGK